jgi:ribose transport system substrate-binding protein
MYSPLRAVAAVSSLPLILLSIGCSGGSRHDSTENYYLVATNIKIPYWRAAFDGLDRASKDLKLRAEMVGPDTYDPKAQQEIFREIVRTKKPTGILISVADPGLMKADIDSAIAAGIPVVTMDSDAPATHRLFFIGTNNYQAGVMGGRVLAKNLNGKGNVVVFTFPAQANLIERLRGYQEALSGTDIKIVETVDVHGAPSIAFDKTKEILSNPKLKVDGFVCLEATSGKEVADVLTRQNAKEKVVIAMDTDEMTLEWIEKGAIAATVAQKPFTMAYYGLCALDELHHNKPAQLNTDWRQNLQAVVPSIIDTGSSLIDKTNVSTMHKSAALIDQSHER